MRILSLNLSSTLPVALSALALCAAPVFAGDEPAKPTHHGERYQKLLEKFDSNRDG